MNLAEQIENALRQQQRQGKTQTEMSEMNGISQSHIQRILSNPENKIKGLKVETLMRMFPRATLNFNGNITTSQTGTNNVVVNGECGTVNNGPHAPVQSVSAEHIRSRIIAALIPLDIPPESLQSVLRTINELDLN